MIYCTRGEQANDYIANVVGTLYVPVYMIDSDRHPVSNRRPLLKSASTDVIISNHSSI
jgi:hypothetical protein